MARTPMDGATVEKMRYAYVSSNLKLEAVASDFGIHRTTLQRYCKGLRRRGHRDAEIRQLLAEGLTQYKIAKRVGLTQAAINRKVQKWRDQP